MRISLLLVFMSVLSLTRTQTTITEEESTAETTVLANFSLTAIASTTPAPTSSASTTSAPTTSPLTTSPLTTSAPTSSASPTSTPTTSPSTTSPSTESTESTSPSTESTESTSPSTTSPSSTSPLTESTESTSTTSPSTSPSSTSPLTESTESTQSTESTESASTSSPSTESPSTSSPSTTSPSTESTTTTSPSTSPLTESTESTQSTESTESTPTTSPLATSTPTTLAAPAIFYPFGSSGDTRNAAVDDGSSSVIPLLSPFLFFGRTYQKIYVNNNGHLTFNQPSSQYVPYSFPAYGGQDIIAGLWTDLDNCERGVISYHQYTNGSVLTRTTLDINNHFPNLAFNASWVFVATWDKVAYFPLTNTETSFQVVLISGSNLSFILMNYGDIAVTRLPVEAGYDTVNSFDYLMIPGSNNGSLISNLKNSSNVNVPGRWAFRVDSGYSTSKKNVVGLRVRFSSVFDITQYGNIMIVQQIKQELVKYGLPSSIEVNLRKLQKIKP